MEYSSVSNLVVLEQLGERFRSARLSRNLTQAQLAEASGVSLSTLRRLESGADNVSLLNVIALMRALGVVDQLDLLLPPQPPSPMASLQNKGAGPQVDTGGERQRASGRRQVAEDKGTWSWGDDA
jgi:transcriptional regulator with XRE-family HTH domain